MGFQHMTGKSNKESAKRDEVHAPAEVPAKNGKTSKGAAGKGRGRKSAKADLAEAKDRLLRLQADFENFRKRTLREKSELYQRANGDIIEELLPVIDHFDLALAAAVEHGAAEAFVEGFRLLADQLKSALKKFGLKPIDVDGQPFDPNLHEAISHLPSDDVPENSILAEARCGYMLGENLLRATQVVVSSGSAEPVES